MFTLLRRMETWVHQHVFKVGWLVTQDYQTTTILYYAFFLPGVVLHEVTYWLAAGAFNVRAERSLKWPEKQEVGELRLNFVQISNRAGLYKRAIISVVPLAAGTLSIWWIGMNVYDLQTVTAIISTGDLEDVATGIQTLLYAPNFWLWAYIIFTVGNTMFPQIPKDLRGWRTIAIIFGAITLVLTVIGLGGEIFETLQTPIISLLEVLQSAIALILLTNFMVVLVLGTIEYGIESTTGRSASFRGGKMVTMTREQVQEEQRKERERERRRAERRKSIPGDAVPATIYALAFPLPGAPGVEPVTELTTASAIIPKSEPTESRVETIPAFGGIAGQPHLTHKEDQYDASTSDHDLPEEVDFEADPESSFKPNDHDEDAIISEQGSTSERHDDSYALDQQTETLTDSYEDREEDPVDE
jgi:hypothetical protein